MVDWFRYIYRSYRSSPLFYFVVLLGGHDRFDGRLAGPSSINYRNANVNVLFLFFFFFYYSIISYCVVAIRYFCLHISTTPEHIRQSLSLSPRGNFEANNNRPLPIHFPFCCCCIAHTERIGYGYTCVCVNRYQKSSFHIHLFIAIRTIRFMQHIAFTCLLIQALAIRLQTFQLVFGQLRFYS